LFWNGGGIALGKARIGKERGLVSQPGAVLQRPEASLSHSVRPGARRRSTAAEVYLRQWLARELHDGAAQTLTTMLVEIEHFKTEQAGRRSVLEQLDALQASTRHVIANLRRTMVMLRDEPNDGPALGEWLADLLERFQCDTGIESTVVGAESWPSPLSTVASINVCRIVEEALHNVRQHSGAQRVLVSFFRDGDMARFYIRDNGRGQPSASAWHGLGTLGMKERAALLGGEMWVESGFGNGMAIEVKLPVENLTS
jgi:signal transduction histidine kinase